MTPFVVERGTLGLSAGKKRRKWDRASNTSEVILEEVRVPAGNRLGKEEAVFVRPWKPDLSRPMIGALA